MHRKFNSFLVLSILFFASAVHGQQPSMTVKLADAPQGDVRLFITDSLRAPALTVVPKLEAATGRKVWVETDESKNLEKEIDAGQPFEAAMLTTTVIELNDRRAGDDRAPLY